MSASYICAYWWLLFFLLYRSLSLSRTHTLHTFTRYRAADNWYRGCSTRARVPFEMDLQTEREKREREEKEQQPPIGANIGRAHDLLQDPDIVHTYVYSEGPCTTYVYVLLELCTVLHTQRRE